VCEYWANEYDWRSRERQLNRFDQFTTPVEGLTSPGLHFVHARSPHPDAMPLLITHGWPGSIVEFHKVIEPLTDPRPTGATPPTHSTSSPVAARFRILGQAHHHRLGRAADRRAVR
jgi:hypothetical protein